MTKVTCNIMKSNGVKTNMRAIRDERGYTMRTFSVELYEKKRNRRVIYTAEEFKFCDGRLWIYHRELGNVVTRIGPYEELTITQDREELTITQDREEDEE